MSDEPETFGPYRLVEKLGEGGMATVWRAERTGAGGFKKRAAVKRMLSHLASETTIVGRFLAEARTNARLEHPNLVHVIDFGTEPEPHLVLEFVDGPSLSAILARCAARQEQLPIEAAIFIVAEAASGLDHAHRKRDDEGRPLGIVHRDVSPQNVLVSAEGAVKVSDFGIAKVADASVRTQQGLALGKLSYMSPEQLEGGEVDARADVWALGVVLWELLTLRPLVPRHSPTAAAIAIKNASFPAPSSVRAEVPPEIDAIVQSTLAGDVEARLSSAQALGQQLREVLHEIAPGYGREQLAKLVVSLFPERGWRAEDQWTPAARPSSVPPPAVPAGAGPEPAIPVTVPRSVPPAKRRRSVLPWIVLGVLAIALVGGGIVTILGATWLGMGAEPGPAGGTQTQTGPSPIATQPAAMLIDDPVITVSSTVPGTNVWAGARHLGVAPVAEKASALEGRPLVGIAAGYLPVVMNDLEMSGLVRQRTQVLELQPQPMLDPQITEVVVFVDYDREGEARDPEGNALGQVPGVVRIDHVEGRMTVTRLHIVDSSGVVASILPLESCRPEKLCRFVSGEPSTLIGP